MNYYKVKVILDILMISLGIVFFLLKHPQSLPEIFVPIMFIIIGGGDLFGIYMKRRKR